MEKMVFELWEASKPLFEKKLAKLNKILRKHGKEPFTFHYENPYEKNVTITEHIKGESFLSDTARQCTVLIWHAVVEGEVLVKKDDKNYRYIGSVRYTDGVKQSYCKDKDFESAFLNFREGMCDHCGTKRMNRKSYFLFEADGKVIQVGSSCLKEYLGISSLDYLRCMEDTFISISEFSEDTFWKSMMSPSFSDTYYGLPFNAIYSMLDYATLGFTKWVKSSMEEYSSTITSTTSQVRMLCNDYFKGVEIPKGKNEIILTREECIDYWTKQPNGVFAMNCLDALKAGYANSRTLGTYCYAIFAAVNAAYKARMAPVEDDSKPCKYEVGKRVNIKGKVLSIRAYEVEDSFSYYGGTIMKYSINFQDEDKALYHFNTGSATFADIKEGDRLELRGKIKEAKEYKGVNYTGLNLPKVVHNFTKEDEEAA